MELEQAFGTPGSKAMGSANFALLSRYYTQPARRTSASLKLNFGGGRFIELNTDDVEAIAKYYDSLPHDSERYNFVYDTMSRADKFNAMLYKIGRRTEAPPANPMNDPENQMTLDINEYASKKKSASDLDRSSVRSAGLSTALRQAYAKYPQAQSDIEALVMHDMDVQKNTGQELKAQARTNQRQDDIDAQMRDVTRKQSNKISSLDQENDDLSAELDRLSQELDSMHRQTGSEPERKPDSDADNKSGDAPDSRDYSVNTRSDGRAEKSQQRAADAEKRQPEPQAPKLRPGSATFKPQGSTLGTVPMVRPNTIDVIDEPGTSPAMDQMVRQIKRRGPAPAIGRPQVAPAAPAPLAPPSSMSQPPETDDPETDPDFDADSAYNAARNAEEQPDTNVFQFPGSTRRGEPEQPDLFDNPPRTGTYNESQELRRMRELAGLTE